MTEAVRVHTLRLHPLRRALPMAPQPWVEDALRCAPVPGAWRHRWVLVRKLHVRLGTQVSSAALADALGAQWQQLAAQALPAEQAPEHAAAVWFADEPAARVAWLKRRLQGAPLRAWFWQQVQAAGAAVSDDVAALLQRPWREDVGAAREHAFRQQVLGLCAALGGPGLPSGGDTSARGAATQQPSDARRSPAARGAGRSAESAADAPHAVQTEASEPVRPEREHTARSATQTARNHAAQRTNAADTPPAQALARTPDARGLDEAPTPAVPAADRVHAAVPAPVHQAFEEARLEAGLPTAWAGFFFALNLWRRQPPPDGDAALAWLHALATWLRVPPEDGVAALLNDLGLPPDTAPPPLRTWRLQALQQTRLPLRRLLAAPGLVRASRTHVDLHLPLRSARLAVRKAGLDIDPGWQPLLQRVVAFHYDQGAAP